MNSDVIHLLPDSVANQIAAGEVIQRPASVVKELVENSIDAGAKKVDIIIKDAGRTLIQVVDDGCGMSATDARLAFERHATSKINQADDLFSLHTMGFRGEALPSIAAVSEIEMRSMRRSDSIGTTIRITASKFDDQQPVATVPGTCIMVKRLFFNLPARRKFLKKDNIELSHIVHEFERLALVNIDTDMSLTHNDATIYSLRRGTLKQRIADLFGSNIQHQIIPIESRTSIVNIDGFVGLPQNARRRGALQYFFVNGRNMRHPYFHKAVLQCYETLISADSQPNYFINLTVDPGTIDVNIHPQKHEIKFENEQHIRQILVATVREALGSFNAVPSIDFNREDAPEIPIFDPYAKNAPNVDFNPQYNPFDTRSSAPGVAPSAPMSSRPSSINKDWDKLYDSFFGESPKQGNTTDTQETHSAPSLTDSLGNKTLDVTDTPGIFSLHGRYIVTPSQLGLMLIDYRRAHINILYNKYIDILSQQQPASQRVLFPERLSLDPTSAIVLSSISPMLSGMGFDIRQGSRQGEYTIHGMPSILKDANPSETVNAIIRDISENDTETTETARSQWLNIALSMARTAAVKRGTQLTKNEMEQLTADLFRLPAPTYTPDGHLVLRVLTSDDIDRLFV